MIRVNNRILPCYGKEKEALNHRHLIHYVTVFNWCTAHTRICTINLPETSIFPFKMPIVHLLKIPDIPVCTIFVSTTHEYTVPYGLLEILMYAYIPFMPPLIYKLYIH
ncbi:potassium voltage-gated channel subfamily G member 1 [Platysternon megacephalum]|uniref:Potassium voltage-gated channel subfamily G member 1 n=1 Tax=Platysternon megacephalum TaxID=55544 RepID=A0A4D9EEM1_9SAUR|nr:potassium voltage-gated channel subfamily G member 1 [Platysternon megacephalum]